jgi:alanine racemase
VDQEAIRHNLRAMRSICQRDVQVWAVVKANAYGHGLAEVVPAIADSVDVFAVDDIEELRQLRNLTDKRATVLGYVPKSELDAALRLNGEVAIYDSERIEALQYLAYRQGRIADVHLKVDALLGRQGILPNEAQELARTIEDSPNLRLLSAYSHFANIEDTTDLAHSLSQSEAFEEALKLINKDMSQPIGRHESATSGVMARESAGTANSVVRIGIGLYGLYPSPALNRSFANLELRPAMRWVTHLAQVKVLPPRHPVGYGLTYITSKPTKIGIVPQGYSDGYDRGLSNAADVLVNGRRCSVLGRIAMNMFAVDLSNCPDAKPEDEVILLGKSGDEEITAEELAQRIGTINYEVVARVSPLLPRVAV